MMRPFILCQSCQKFSIQPLISGNKVFLPLLLLILSVDIVQADTVQRWQDSHGQWHFGDQAATIGRKTQPVIITNPISVIQNDQVQPTKNKVAVVKPNKKTKKHSNTETNELTSAKNKHKQQCNLLREQVYRQPVTSKASQLRQNLVRQYEQNCISGNYYGD